MDLVPGTQRNDKSVGSFPDSKLQADEHLMGRVAQGDRAAQKQLIGMLWRRVLNMVRHICCHSQETDDLTQETFLQILRAASGYRAEGCLEAWADVITVRTVMKRLGRLRRRQAVLTPVREDTTASPADLERGLLEKVRSERIAELLGHLNADQRLALVLKLAYGYTLEETAAIMERSVGSVQQLLRKGRSKLRRLAVRDARLRELFPWRVS